MARKKSSRSREPPKRSLPQIEPLPWYEHYSAHEYLAHALREVGRLGIGEALDASPRDGWRVAKQLFDYFDNLPSEAIAGIGRWHSLDIQQLVKRPKAGDTHGFSRLNGVDAARAGKDRGSLRSAPTLAGTETRTGGRARARRGRAADIAASDGWPRKWNQAAKLSRLEGGRPVMAASTTVWWSRTWTGAIRAMAYGRDPDNPDRPDRSNPGEFTVTGGSMADFGIDLGSGEHLRGVVYNPNTGRATALVGVVRTGSRLEQIERRPIQFEKRLPE